MHEWVNKLSFYFCGFQKNIFTTFAQNISKLKLMKRIIALIDSVVSKGDKHPEIKQVKKIGELNVPTGKIVVCDPLVEPEIEPIIKDFPKGKFPVYLYYSNEEDCIAFAELRFSEAPVQRWEMALVDDQDLKELEENEIFGYAVDSSLGCFMDIEGQKAMLKHEMELSDQLGDKFTSYYDNYIDNLFFGPGAVDEYYCEVKPYDSNPNNVFVFQAGYGEGFYGTYIGYDKDGKISKLLTDFNILEE